MPTHNIAPHTSLHDLPCHRTIKKYENSWSMEAFLFLPRKFAIQTWLCNCPQYFCLFHIVFEFSPSIHDQGKMLVLPNRLLTFHIGHKEARDLQRASVTHVPAVELKLRHICVDFRLFSMFVNHLLGIQRTSCTRPDSESVSDSAFCITI